MGGSQSGTWVNSMERTSSVARDLRAVGLRPTEQRIALFNLLFAGGHRHVTAEELHAEVLAHGISLSVATVYNALNDFTVAGLVRVLAVEGARTWFDTNISDHHHFYVEGDGEIRDIDASSISIANIPEPPEGFEIANIDVVIRVRPISGR
ncbi:transcriptional repressor (plasmid) [Rhizobium leguminosarum]|uniref:Ferric uptake regulation protein n=4 Tax=Rhizobium TaxID=379 RepID=Q1M6P1_RHIJ3|nr:transcriptional repressor [Rhizobium leguminosarum]NKK54436.1 transcriptional repressor [Rhizobium leguminosarum bv. viciae]CAK03092.1 putative FUR family transcriptional regulator [Rhizobium johnstonii 3841]NEJ79551.1 transcriptional repressor [Rhizobium leguminosarum]RWX36997.1 transcriptional repressor [Rhizobium leguminosarum]